MNEAVDRKLYVLKLPINLATTVEVFGIAIVLFLAAYVRLINLEVNPGWYSDEGTLINIAKNLINGRWQYMALNQSTLIAARLPLFPWLLSEVFRWYEPGIVTLRTFTGLLGVVAVGLVYGLVRLVQPERISWKALLTAFMLAIYPEAVVHTRLGFSYNLLAIFALLACWGLWSYLKNGRVIWLLLTAIVIGLGIVTDLMMVTFILPTLIIISMHGWKKIALALTVMLLPFAFYGLWMIANVPQAFWFDLRFTVSRLGTITGVFQLPAVLFNYFALILRDPWALLGIIGLFVIRPMRWRGMLLLLLFLPLISLGRTTGYGAGLGTYYIIALLPFFAIGMGGLIWLAIPLVLNTLKSGLEKLLYDWGVMDIGGGWLQHRAIALISSLGVFLIVISPFLLTTAMYFMNAEKSYSSSADPILINSHDARLILDFINQQIQPDDLVIASPALAWGINANAADFQQSLASQGIATKHFPADIPADRFAFNPDYQRARYVVIDKIWRNWAALNMPEVAEMMAEVERWPMEYSAGEIQVYRNPKLQ